MSLVSLRKVKKLKMSFSELPGSLKQVIFSYWSAVKELDERIAKGLLSWNVYMKLYELRDTEYFQSVDGRNWSLSLYHEAFRSVEPEEARQLRFQVSILVELKRRNGVCVLVDIYE